MNTQSLRETHALIQRAVDDIQVQLDHLVLELDFLRPQWSGEAADAYTKAQQQWNATMARMNHLLRAAGGAAENAVDRQLEARAKVAALWR